MTFLYGATITTTPQFDKSEVAEETSPLMGARNEHVKPGKGHAAMPVVQRAPAAERSGSADTIANGQSPEPVRQLSGLLMKLRILGKTSWLKKRLAGLARR